jgi:hypothetical protein
LVGVPQAFLSNSFPQDLTPACGKQHGRNANLSDNISLPEYERRPPINDLLNFSVQCEIWGNTILDITFFKNFVSRDLLSLNLNKIDARLSSTSGAEPSQIDLGEFPITPRRSGCKGLFAKDTRSWPAMRT